MNPQAQIWRATRQAVDNAIDRKYRYDSRPVSEYLSRYFFGWIAPTWMDNYRSPARASAAVAEAFLEQL